MLARRSSEGFCRGLGRLEGFNQGSFCVYLILYYRHGIDRMCYLHLKIILNFTQLKKINSIFVGMLPICFWNGCFVKDYSPSSKPLYWTFLLNICKNDLWWVSWWMVLGEEAIIVQSTLPFSLLVDGTAYPTRFHLWIIGRNLWAVAA